MSAEYQGQEPSDISKQAERDLNSYAAKQGLGSQSDSANESGIDESAVNRFPGADVTYGSAASGAGDNREIPESEGGSINPRTGQPTKARDFEGPGGPETKAQMLAREAPGSDYVRSNIRQGGEVSYEADRNADRR